MVEYTIFSSACATFAKRILGHKGSLDKFKRAEIIQNSFLGLKGIKLEIHNKNSGKSPNICKLNCKLPNNAICEIILN